MAVNWEPHYESVAILFLYQSETDTHFQCPSCGQRGSVPTHALENALRDNAHVKITCTKCKEKFEPHAAAADSPTPHPPADNIIDETDKASRQAKSHLPDLQDIWQQYDAPKNNRPENETSTADTAANLKPDFPVWMQRAPTPEAKPVIAAPAAEIAPDIEKQDIEKPDIEKQNTQEPETQKDETAYRAEAATDTQTANLIDDEVIDDLDAVLPVALPDFEDETDIAETEAGKDEAFDTIANDDLADDDLADDALIDETPEDDFDDDVVIGRATAQVLPDTPYREEETEKEREQQAEEVKVNFFTRLLSPLRALFARQQAPPEPPSTAPAADDDDGLRVFGDDDFLDDEAFEEARRLAAVENAMQADKPAADA